MSLCVFHLLLDFLFPLLVFYYYSKLYAFNCSFMTFKYWLNYYSFITCFYFWKTDNHSILLSFPSDFSFYFSIWTLESACLSCWVFPWCRIFLPEDMDFLFVSVLFCVLRIILRFLLFLDVLYFCCYFICLFYLWQYILKMHEILKISIH